MTENFCDKFLVRRAILLQLDAASPASIPFETLALGLSCAGFSCSERHLEAALDYLEQKGYTSLSRSKISAAHRRAKITAQGKDYLEGGEF